MTDVNENSEQSENLDCSESTILENLTEFEFVKFPDSSLQKPSIPVDDFSYGNDFIRNLFYTMKINGGISISATNVGVDKRIVLVNITEPLVMYNPAILTMSDETETVEESNFAFLGHFYSIKRSKEITVTYQNETGGHIVTKATGMLSASIQHEVDAINGVMFYDHYNPVAKLLAIKKLKKFIKKSHK